MSDAVKKGKKVAKKVAKKAKGDKKSKGGKTGRPLKESTQDRRKAILGFTKKPVTNTVLAEKLGVTTAKSQSYARPMVKEGLLKAAKDPDTFRVTYVAV